MFPFSLMEHESAVRVGAFIGALVLVGIGESLAPRRARVARRLRRTINNLLLVLVDTLVVRMLPAISAVGAAAWAARSRTGLLNRMDLPDGVEGIATFLALDLVIYGQHLATHRFDLLWRFHRVHHADLDLDGSSGVRFHPVEILLSMCVKCGAVIVLGAGVEAVVLFEIVLNAASIFNHGNIRLAPRLDRLLRMIVVTPDMHRVHHSILPDETHSNFGFNMPWWDWMFRTYRAQPRDPHENLTLGLPRWRTEQETVPLTVLLWMPFDASD